MEFIKPNATYLDEYLAACKESHDNNITEWMPVELDELDKMKALNKLMSKLNEAEISIREHGTISTDELELELGV